MKLNKIIFLIAFLFAVSTSAQKVSLRWSKKIPTKREITILGGINNKYYTTHRGKKQELIGRIYDEKMNMIQEKSINFNLSAKKYFYQGAFFVEGKILHFIKDNVRKRGKSSIYAAFSDANLDTSSKVLVVDETLKRRKTSFLGTRNISPDSTKVMLYHQIERKKKEPKKIVYKVYNSGITKIIQQDTVSIPIKAKNFSTQLVEVDNLGNFYLLARVNKERKEREKNHSKYYFKLFVFSKDNQ